MAARASLATAKVPDTAKVLQDVFLADGSKLGNSTEENINAIVATSAKLQQFLEVSPTAPVVPEMPSKGLYSEDSDTTLRMSDMTHYSWYEGSGEQHLQTIQLNPLFCHAMGDSFLTVDPKWTVLGNRAELFIDLGLSELKYLLGNYSKMHIMRSTKPFSTFSIRWEPAGDEEELDEEQIPCEIFRFDYSKGSVTVGELMSDVKNKVEEIWVGSYPRQTVPTWSAFMFLTAGAKAGRRRWQDFNVHRRNLGGNGAKVRLASN